MAMDYGKIIKRSWEIFKTNKFLWWLGILAAFTSGNAGMPSFPGGGGGGGGNQYQVAPSPSPSFSGAEVSWSKFGQVLGDMTEKGKVVTDSTLTASTIVLIVAVGVIFFLIGLAIYYFSVSANAGLILAVDKIETTGEKMTFKTAISAGRKFFWKFFGVAMLYTAWVFAFLLILGLFVLIGFISKNAGVIAILVALGIIIFIGFLIATFYLALLLLFIHRLIVLDGVGPISAIKRAHLLVKNNWKEVIISWLIMVAIGFGAGIVIFLAVLLLFAVFGLIGYGLYTIGGWFILVPFAIVIGILFFIAIMIVRGLVTAYTSTYTTLVYRALRYINAQKI